MLYTFPVSWSWLNFNMLDDAELENFLLWSVTQQIGFTWKSSINQNANKKNLDVKGVIFVMS